MLALRSLRLPRACARALHTFSLDSKGFPTLRARGSAFVDTTGAIADLLNYAEPGNAHRVFFSRPRKFGKSLTLSIAAEMLAAGELPQGVAPWPGYAPVDVPALFGGLQVHQRLLAGDASLRGLLQRPHFVVKLGLGMAQSGADLKRSIIRGVASIARKAVGPAFASEVAAVETPGDALGMLLDAVPSSVPVALLVDEYDAAILQDVSKGRWGAADAGMEALRSLAMATKCPNMGSRIERCLFTGVARFSRSFFSSSANNFADLTCDPLLSRVLGFSAAEIRATFPKELERLAKGQGTDVSGAMQQLEHWYGGYCFDGASTCFYPFPVLSALDAGSITQREMEAARDSNWLGLSTGDLVLRLVEELQYSGAVKDAERSDIADLEEQRVPAVPLLLQTGLLSVAPGQTPLQCRPPNEYARASLQTMLVSAMEDNDSVNPGLALRGLHAALKQRSPGAFAESVRALLLMLPAALSESAELACKGKEYEAAYLRASLACALLATAQAGVQVDLESGAIIVRFGGAAAWVVEVGVGGGSDAWLAQAQVHGEAQPEQSVLCCAVVASAEGSASTACATGDTPVQVTCKWSERVVADEACTWRSV